MMDARRSPFERLHLPAAGAGGSTPAGQRLTFRVGGLTCAADATHLEHDLRREPGVLEVVVNPITETTYITIDPIRTTPEAIRRRIDATPYGPAAS